MKALVYKAYGPVRQALSLEDLAIPEPEERQVLVKVKAASVNALDYRRFKNYSAIGKFLESKVFKNTGKVLGADISGVVHAIGKKVTKYKPGDEVFGFTGTTRGGFAEFACAEENTIALKPTNISFESAAAVPVAGCTAFQALKKRNPIRPGEKILINGASGGVGTFAIQLSKSQGAVVTAVCSTQNLEKAKAMGADEVIDYTKADFTKQKQRYDLILGVNGFHPILSYKRCLSGKGTYVAIGGEIKQIFQAILFGPILSLFSTQKLMFMGISKANSNELNLLANLLSSGKIVPQVDQAFHLSNAPDAFNYILDKHVQGKVVLTI